jgi:hypothetical protein
VTSRRGGVSVAWLAILGACRSGTSLSDHDASDTQTCDPSGASMAPSDPCAVDSDCHNPYLECAPTTVYGCREPASQESDAGCSPASLATAPICPATAMLTIGLCTERFQEPCVVDADCGPDGFTCTSGHCDGPLEAAICSTDGDCPKGWSCYVPCACASRPDDPKRCYPPFSRFNCPACGVATPADTASEDGGPGD